METKSFRQRILNLEIGDTLTIPVSMLAYTTIRSYSSDLGFAFERKFETHRNRKERTYTIKRTA